MWRLVVEGEVLVYQTEGAVEVGLGRLVLLRRTVVAQSTGVVLDKIESLVEMADAMVVQLGVAEKPQVAWVAVVDRPRGHAVRLCEHGQAVRDFEVCRKFRGLVDRVAADLVVDANVTLLGLPILEQVKAKLANVVEVAHGAGQHGALDQAVGVHCESGSGVGVTPKSCQVLGDAGLEVDAAVSGDVLSLGDLAAHGQLLDTVLRPVELGAGVWTRERGMGHGTPI